MEKIKLPDHLDEATRKKIEARLAIYNAARSGDVEAQIWYLKNVAGWKEKTYGS